MAISHNKYYNSQETFNNMKSETQLPMCVESSDWHYQQINVSSS